MLFLKIFSNKIFILLSIFSRLLGSGKLFFNVGFKKKSKCLSSIFLFANILAIILDKLNDILDVEISFFGNKLLIVGKKHNVELAEDLINKVITDTSNSWSKYKSSKSVLDATRTQLKAAEIANEGITLEYDSGNTRTTLEVIQSRSLLLDARIAFAKAKRDFMVSQFELAKHIGILSLKTIK